MKVFPPDIPKELQDDISLVDKLLLDERVEEAAFSGENYAEENLKGLDVLRSRFTKCDFSGCELEQAGFRDVVFEACDFSNCKITKSGFQRVVFKGCKLTGADFVETALRYVRFSECGGEYVNFADSKVQDTAFEKCRLPRMAMLRCKLNAVFEECEFAQSLFQQTPLKDIDLRTCGLGGIQITLPDVNGAIVTPLQASDLAVLMGLVIKEREET